MNISLVVATDMKFGIGKDNKLLWKLSNDMQHFRELTTDNVVIMGRKTFESIGRPLPYRTNIILTRDREYTFEVQGKDVYVYNYFEDLLQEIKDHAQDQEIFVIGGAEIYKLFLPYANKIYMTTVIEIFDADTFFPDIDYREWSCTSFNGFQADADNEYNHTISTFEKRVTNG